MSEKLLIIINDILRKDSIYIDGLGRLHIHFSHRAKYARISVNTSSKVTVTIPNQLKKKDAIIFVKSKREWIIRNKIKASKRKLLKLDLSRNQLNDFWKKSEKKIFFLSKSYSFEYNDLIFKTLKSRWGSCSSNNIICLNNLLYYLPDYLQEYVMLHELVHTKVKNHSSQFWNQLESICEDSKIKSKELKDNYAFG